MFLSKVNSKRIFTRLTSRGALRSTQRFSTSEAYTTAYETVFGSRDESSEIAFLGTGPMALSLAANMVKSMERNGLPTPKIVLLTDQGKYYDALKNKGFKVLDERDGSVVYVPPNQLKVVRSVQEYEETSSTAPKVIYGTMQMGKKTDRWELVDVAKARHGDGVTVLTAANGIPFTTMLDKVEPLNLRTGHATMFAKARVDFFEDMITVTTTDNGRISLGAVSNDPEKLAASHAHFESLGKVMEGPIYTTEHSTDAAGEAMTKVIRNLTNCICLGLTSAQYHFSGTTSDLKAMPYGVHLKKSQFLNTLNVATYQACRALGMDSKEAANQIVENLKYVMGPAIAKIDLDAIRDRFEDGIDDIKSLEKSRPTLNGAEVRHRMFGDLSKSISKKMRKALYAEAGSTHPPTDAQAAAIATPGGIFGTFIPTKPIENKITELIRRGEARGCENMHMDVLYAFSELYDVYNSAVSNGTAFEIPDSFFKVFEDQENETDLLANVDSRILKLSWMGAEKNNKSGISVAAQRKQWLGESAIRNAKLIAELTKAGFTFLRYDVGGVALTENDAVIEARKSNAAANNKYSPICEPEVLDSLAKFYTDTGAGRTFTPNEVMVLGVRSKGALPWMLDFVGSGPIFVPRPTYNPNPSAGLYHQRNVVSFDVTGPNRYAPMIEALRKHKGSGLVVIPIIGNPFSTTLTEEEEKGLIEVLNENQSMGWFGDHAYRGYNVYRDSSGKLTTFNNEPTRDVMEAGGFYDNSPKDPVTGKIKNFRVTTHSSSKLFNDASGPGTVAAHADTINFLGDMLRGSFTQAHQRDRRTIPAIVDHIDYDAPKRWMGAMEKFDQMTIGRIPGFKDLGADTPPFKCYDASEFLARHDLHPEEAQHYFMSRSPGLCGIFGGFGPGSSEIFRLGFTGEAPERAPMAAQRFIEYVNDHAAIAKFKAREDILTRVFFKALDEIQGRES